VFFGVVLEQADNLLYVMGQCRWEGGKVANAFSGQLDKATVLAWLLEKDAAKLQSLWRWADEVRAKTVGDQVHLRGLLEVSNYCARQCSYCGIRTGNKSIARYRMTADEIVQAARQAASFRYGTVVLQGGEDFGLTTAWVEDVVRRIKAETDLAITLSLGERFPKELERWRKAGADRYLLRFETSDQRLFDRIHPPLKAALAAGQVESNAPNNVSRWELLTVIRDLGYELGSGVMVGIPGQTWESLADDILWFGKLDLDMIGVGPFIPHPETPLAGAVNSGPDFVTADVKTTCKVVALARIIRPDANIPATTALGTVDRVNGRELGLRRGANVIMPNITPLKYRQAYEIYPDKAALNAPTEDEPDTVMELLNQIGRVPGVGQGKRGG